MRRLCLLAAATLSLAALAGAQEARTVRYGPKDVIKIACKTRNTTLIILPAGERILDLVIGDRDMWLLEGTDRYAYLKPAGHGLSTTINIIAASGNVYTFLAREVGDAPADVKLFVELSDPSQFHAVGPQPRFVPAEEAEALKAQISQLASQAAKEREAFAAEYPASISFNYVFASGQKPFHVSAIWHDATATYIRCEAREKPALYEVLDGKPVLVNYELRGNVYIVPKILSAGRLVIGKRQLDFFQRS